MRENPSNSSSTDEQIRKSAILFLYIASIGILICIGLITNALIAHQPIYKIEFPDSSPFNTQDEYVGFCFIVLDAIGLLLLFIAIYIVDAVKSKKKITSWSLFFLGCCVVLISNIAPILVDHKPWLQPWALLYPMVTGMCACGLSLTYLLDRFGNKKIAGILQLFFIAFMFGLGLFSPYVS